MRYLFKIQALGPYSDLWNLTHWDYGSAACIFNAFPGEFIHTEIQELLVFGQWANLKWVSAAKHEVSSRLPTGGIRACLEGMALKHGEWEGSTEEVRGYTEPDGQIRLAEDRWGKGKEKTAWGAFWEEEPAWARHGGVKSRVWEWRGSGLACWKHVQGSTQKKSGREGLKAVLRRWFLPWRQCWGSESVGICVDRSPAGPAVLPVCRGYPWGLWSEADVGKGERGCGQPRRPDQVLKHFHPCLTSKCISLLQVSMCLFFFSQSSPPPVNLLGAGGRVCVCVCPS